MSNPNPNENEPPGGSGSTGATVLESLSSVPSRGLAAVIGATGAVAAALPTPVGGGPEGRQGSAAGTHRGPTHEDRPDPDEARQDWSVETPFEDEDIGSIEVGDRVAFTKTLGDAELRRFARATGDANPLHLDAEYAEDTRFDGRIVHGALLSGLVGAALSNLPGVVVVLAQDQRFRAPVGVGDRVTAEAEVAEALGSDRYRLRTTVEGSDGTVRLDGEVTVLVEPPPDG